MLANTSWARDIFSTRPDTRDSPAARAVPEHNEASPTPWLAAWQMDTLRRVTSGLSRKARLTCRTDGRRRREESSLSCFPSSGTLGVSNYG